MKKIIKYLITSILASVLLSSCAGFEPAKLGTRADTPIYKPSDQTGIVLGDSVLYDFKGALGPWWNDSKIQLTKFGSAMRVTASGVGPGYEPFGLEFDEMSFEKAPFLRLRMKLAPGTTDYPTLRVDLKDANGIQTNGSPASVVIDSSGYAYYYFDYFKKFKQTYPDNADVDPTRITGLQCFINPGGKPWKGTFYIDEIYSMSNPDGSGNLPDYYVLDDFSGSVDLWWPCKPDKVSVTKQGTDKLKVSIKDGQWDCFGKVFAEVDITEMPIIRIRARAESKTGMTKSNIMARFIDANDNATDLIDGKNMRDFEIGGSEYKDYYSIFRTSFSDDLYSSTGDFDPKRVNRVIVFFNMNQEANFTGDVIVDEIAFVKKLPASVSEVLENKWGQVPSLNAEWPVGQSAGVLADFSSVSGWESNASDLSVSGSGGKLKLDANVTRTGWAAVTGKVKPSNLSQDYYIKIKAKSTGKISPTLRLTVIDNFGTESNARPQEFTVANTGEMGEYYVKLFNSGFQRSPDFKVVNLKSIEQIKLYVHPGLGDYKGTIEIDELSFLNVNDVPEDVRTLLKER